MYLLKCFKLVMENFFFVCGFKSSKKKVDNNLYPKKKHVYVFFATSTRIRNHKILYILILYGDIIYVADQVPSLHCTHRNCKSISLISNNGNQLVKK